MNTITIPEIEYTLLTLCLAQAKQLSKYPDSITPHIINALKLTVSKYDNLPHAYPPTTFEDLPTKLQLYLKFLASHNSLKPSKSQLPHFLALTALNLAKQSQNTFSITITGLNLFYSRIK